MDVKMKAKTAGASAGAGIGLFSAAAVADDLATVTMHALQLDPNLPPDVAAAAARLVTMGYGLAIAGVTAAVGWFLSPASKETDNAKIVPGA